MTLKPRLDTPSSRPLRDFLTFRLARLTQALNAQVTEILEDHGPIGLTDWRVLAIVAGGGAQSARDIVSQTGFDAAQVSRALRHLEDGGLVLTVRDDHERHLAELELEFKATHDALTTLPDRSTLQSRLDALLAAPDRERNVVDGDEAAIAADVEQAFVYYFLAGIG